MQSLIRPDKEMFTSQYATCDEKMQDRVKAFRSDGFRTDFQRDIQRIIYSQAFRRLKHKTQVFFLPENDHVCTRMEHVLHVASASRTVARCLRLNEDLAEAIALAHDIGHAPFGHEGERVLDDIVKEKRILPHFDHEVNGLRVVDKLAQLDREPPGLNLTRAVRDGIISHCGEDRKSNKLVPSKTEKMLESIVSCETAGMPLTLEGCIVRIVDKIVYSGRDIEDAIRTGVIKELEVRVEIREAIGNNNGEILGTFLEDLIENSDGKSYLCLSDSKGELLNALIDFNVHNIYTSEIAEKYNKQARHILETLFDHLLSVIESTKRFSSTTTQESLLTSTTTTYTLLERFVTKDMKDVYEENDPDGLIVLDFVAGMTDNFAVKAFQEIFIPKSTA